LIHIPDYRAVLEKVLHVLKPGGCLALEEPYFSIAHMLCGSEAACHAFERVNRALRKMYAGMGIDHTIGLKLPEVFQSLGVRDFQVDHDAPISRGGSGIARLMKMSSEQLHGKYVGTGEATGEDVEAYCNFADDPGTWSI